MGHPQNQKRCRELGPRAWWLARTLARKRLERVERREEQTGVGRSRSFH